MRVIRAETRLTVYSSPYIKVTKKVCCSKKTNNKFELGITQIQNFRIIQLQLELYKMKMIQHTWKIAAFRRLQKWNENKMKKWQQKWSFCTSYSIGNQVDSLPLALHNSYRRYIFKSNKDAESASWLRCSRTCDHKIWRVFFWILKKKCQWSRLWIIKKYALIILRLRLQLVRYKNHRKMKVSFSWEKNIRIWEIEGANIKKSKINK